MIVTLQAWYDVRTNSEPILSVQRRNNPEQTLNQFWTNPVLETREILPVVLRATYPENWVALTESK